MKSRNWILVLGAGLLLLVVVVTLWLRYVNINQEIRQSLIAAVQEAGIEQFSIDRVRLKLNSLELHDVRLLMPEAGIDLHVDRVTALFSLMEYFNSGFNPAHSVPYFIIERPVLQVFTPVGATASGGTPWWELLRATSFIHRFFLVDGSIGLRSDAPGIVPWHFSAHLGSPTTDSRELALNLGPDSDRAAAVQFRANVDLNSTAGALELHVDSLHLSTAELPPLPAGLSLQSVLTRAHFQLDFDSTGSNLHGQGQLEAGRAVIAHQLELPLVTMRCVGSGDSLSLELKDVTGFPGEVSAQGVASLRGFHFNSQVDDLDLSRSQLWLEETPISGYADLDISGAGSWQAPRLALGITADAVQFADQPSARAQLFLTTDSSGGWLHELNITQTDRKLWAAGDLFNWHGSWLPELDWGFSMELAQPPLSVSAEGILQRPQSEWKLLGSSRIIPQADSSGIDSLLGTISLSEPVLTICSVADQAVDYCLEVELTNPLHWQIELDHAERLAGLLNMELPEGLSSSLNFSGDLEGTNGDLELTWNDYRLLLPADVDFRQREFHGDLYLASVNQTGLQGTVACNWHVANQFVLEELLIDDALQLSGVYNLTSQQGNMRLRSDSWPLQRLQQLDLIQRLPTGNLNADLELQWQENTFAPRGFLELTDTDLPALQGDRLRLESAVFHDSIRAHIWTFDDRLPLLECAAVFDQSLQNGDAQLITGRQHPASLFRLPFSLGGSLNLDLAAQLRKQHWGVTADLDWGKPSLNGYHFDRLSVQLHSRPDLSSWCLDTLLLVRDEAKYPLVISGGGALGEPGDSLLLAGKGDLLELISQGSSVLKEAESYCDFQLQLTGTVTDLQPVKGYFRTSNATMRPTVLTPRISDFDLNLELADGRLKIHELRSKHPTGRITIHNIFEPPADYPELEPLELPGPGINFGIFVISDEVHGMQAVPGVEMNIPGLMKEQWSGMFHFTGHRGKGDFYFAGPLESPLLHGRIALARTEFTYPLIGGQDREEDAEGPLSGFLESLRWDLELQVGLSNSYSNDIEGLGDWQYANIVPDYFTTIQMRIKLDPGDRLHLTGSMLDESFRMTGRVNSTQGTVQLLNQKFNIDEAGLEFDEASLLPLVHGQASLMVADSTGFTKDIHLTLYMLDAEGNRQIRGRWGKMTFDLSDDYSTPRAQILTEIGLGSGLMDNPMQDISGSLLQQAMLPYMTRVEHSIQQLFGLDMVQLRTDILSNYLGTHLFGPGSSDPLEEAARTGESESVSLLAGSNFVVGKFITPNMMLSYSGSLFNQYQKDLLADDLQYRQALKVDYRITRNLGMMVEMAYDPVFRYDERIMLSFRQFY
jgi:hypothetical protein